MSSAGSDEKGQFDLFWLQALVSGNLFQNKHNVHPVIRNPKWYGIIYMEKWKKGIIYDIFLTKYCYSPRQNSIPRYYSFCVNSNWAWLSYWGHWNSGVMNWLHFAKLAEPKVDTIVLYWIIFLTKIMMICDLLFYIG